jgi:hypothetical protein
MIPAPFSYRRADSVAEALDLITEYGDDGSSWPAVIRCCP